MMRPRATRERDDIHIDGGECPAYTRAEEVANAITHGIAAALGLAGLVILVVLASLERDPIRIVSFSIYGASLVTLFVISTLYHGIPVKAAKRVLRRLDHAAIYLLIAGTYTPFMLVSLPGGWGWTLLGIVWGLAAVGVGIQLLCPGRFKALSMILYLGMGWLAIVAIKPMVTFLAAGAMVLIFAGGLLYTLGVVFYAWERLPFNHAIWHVFVIGASACFFCAVAFYVLPK